MNLKEAISFLTEKWGNDAAKVIGACKKVVPFGGNFKDFLSHCTACGGNWGGMLLSGIRELWPDVWATIPYEMGKSAFPCLCYVLQLCGVDTSKG